MDTRRKILIATLMVLCLSLFGFAEEGHDDGHHGFNWVGFIGKLFDSTVLFGGLIIFLRKPIINLLSQKSLEIKTDIVQREDRLKNSTQQLEDIRQRVERIESEVQAMSAAAKVSGEDEKQRLEDLGKQEAQRIKDLSKEEIDTRVDNAVRRLKEKIADLAIDHFKTGIAEHLDKKNHERIIEKNINISGDIIERK